MRNKKSVARPQQHREIVMRRKRYHEPETQNGGELQRLSWVWKGPLTLWLCLARISALLLYTVAVAAGQQQCEGDDC
jgi:hypothetical protein